MLSSRSNFGIKGGFINFMNKEKRIQELEEELKNLKVHECEVWSRVVGYYRPIAQWNNGRQAEWNERKKFDLKEFI